MAGIRTPVSGLTMLERGPILRSVGSDDPPIAASGKDGLKEIVELLKSEDEQARFTALDSLSKAALPETQEALTRYLSREDVPQFEKTIAAAGLVWTGKKEYLRFIVDSVEHQEGDWPPWAEIELLGDGRVGRRRAPARAACRHS